MNKLSQKINLERVNYHCLQLLCKSTYWQATLSYSSVLLPPSAVGHLCKKKAKKKKKRENNRCHESEAGLSPNETADSKAGVFFSQR
jgi:hypothetical protein